MQKMNEQALPLRPLNANLIPPPSNISIYIVTHKPYTYAQEAIYLPIQVGTNGVDSFCACRDNTGDNISAKNASYCELTALYWMWKHAESDVIGLVHYRRYFASRRYRKDPWKRIIKEADIVASLQNADIILPVKRHYVIETNYSQYAHAHHEKDLQLTRDLIQTLYPSYLSAFDKIMKRRSGHRFNMFIMRRELLDRYCNWLFPLLEALEKQIDVSDYDAYNRRVIGFIAERLLDVWLTKEELSYRELPVVSMERVNWLKKGWSFCKRKINGTFRRKKPDKRINL